MFVYPRNDLDRGRTLLSLLGSFWSSIYEGRDVVRKFTEARAEVEQQNWLNLMEAVRSFSRYEVPIFHTQNWYLHIIRKNEQRLGELTWPCPSNLHHVPLIMNRIADPSVVLTAGLDYTITNGTITFKNDPFSNPSWGTRPILDGDDQPDCELFLWLFRGKFDWKTVYNHWGYVLGLSLDSSEAYRDLLNAIFDAIVGGTAYDQVRLTYAALTGLPLTRGQETVEAIYRFPTHIDVITDRNTYRLPPNATLTTSEGQTLRPLETLTEGLQFAELNRGEVPSWVNALVLGRGMLVGKFHSDLVFENRDYPLTVTTDEDGYTRVEFPIGGFPLDVEEFWDRVHYQGRARGKTLAQLLDTRTNTEGGQPEPVNLPRAINPVRFLVENVLRNNVLLVRVKMSELAVGAIGLHPARLLRKIVPPGTTVLVLVEVSPHTTSVILNEPPTVDLPGGRHKLGSFRGAARISEMIVGSFLPKRVSAWKVSGTCQ